MGNVVLPVQFIVNKSPKQEAVTELNKFVLFVYIMCSN